MSRRGVSRSTKKAISARTRPGAAARSYTRLDRAHKTPPRRENTRTTSTVDSARSSNPLDPSRNRAIDAVERPNYPTLDPRLGYGTPQGPQYMPPANADELAAAFNFGNIDLGVGAPQNVPGFGQIGLGPLIDPRYAANPPQGQQIYDHSPLSDFESSNGEDRPIDPYDDFMNGALLALETQMRLRDEAIARGEAEVAAQYNDVINGLQGDINDARRAKAESNAAFEAYRATVEPHLSASQDAAANIDLSELAAMQGAEAVTQTFDSGVAELDGLLEKIGATDPDVAGYVEGQVRDFQVLAEDMMRDDLANTMRVAEAGSKFAKATADYMAAEDETMTEVERQRVEAGINAQIEALQDSLADAMRQRDAAISKAREQIASQFGDPQWFDSPDEAWQYVYSSWADGKGFDPETWDDINSFVQAAAGSGAKTRAEAEKFAMQFVMSSRQALIEESLGMSLSELSETSLDGMSVARILQGFVEQDLEGVDLTHMSMIPDDLRALLGELPTIADYTDALDGYDLYRQHIDSWNDYKTASAAYNGAVKRGGSAPNNYENRNQPAYKYRREVVAPHYASTIKNLFPGAEIGGLGYIRPPDHVGGGKAPNSDHQSGGAIDVYFKQGTPAESDAMLKQIQAWAMQQPGVSYVVYEGDHNHQKHGRNDGHVHISFAVGWQVP